MNRVLNRFVMTAVTALGIIAATVATASPAQAYGSGLRVLSASVNTGNCKAYGDLTAVEYPAGCKLYDSADNTFFKKDAGGTATKVELYNGGEMVAKVEFHPYGEWLWVYDTKNDGDTIYVSIMAYYDGRWHGSGPYSPPGTGTVVEYTKINKSYPEGAPVTIYIHDDAGRTDHILTASAIA